MNQRPIRVAKEGPKMTYKRLLGLVATLVIAVALLVACSGQQAKAPTGGSSSSTITLQNFAFNPASLTVSSGTTVTFKNADQVQHHIVVGTTDLGLQQPGESKTWKASKDGVYVMRCLIHPSMRGQLTVGAGGSTIGTAPAGGATGGGY